MEVDGKCQFVVDTSVQPLKCLISDPQGQEGSGHSLSDNEVLWLGSEDRTIPKAPSDHGYWQGPSCHESKGEGVSHL